MDLSPLALLGCLRSDLEQSLGDQRLNSAGETSYLLSCDPRVVAADILEKTLLKKFRGDSRNRKDADIAALNLFLQWNARCEAWVEPVAEDDADALLLGEFRNCFMKCFETPNGEVVDFSQLAPMFFKVGPGAAVGAKLTDLYTKLYAGDLSFTSDDLYWHYYDSTLPFELENTAEIIRSVNFKSVVVEGSNLGFAAKNATISRTRCTEPSLNMVYQLGTGAVLEGIILQRYGIDLATQPDCNRELSRIGSLSRRFSTTDLSSASDATAVKFFKWAMPYREVHNWFMWIRSDRTLHPFKKGEWIDLHMLSSMGNGYTFPLMTLIFLCVVDAVYKYLGIPLVRNRKVSNQTGSETRTIPGNFGVFGDDIIVDSRAFRWVNHLLKLLGYAVNGEKSFGPSESGKDGVFRESCGTDWFNGHNVRGVYCKALDTPQRRYTLINRLNAWSAEWDIPLPKTIGFLLKTVWYLPVPPWEAADSGVIVPLSVFTSTKRDIHGGFVYSAMRPVTAKWDPAKGLTVRHLVKKEDAHHSLDVNRAYFRKYLKRAIRESKVKAKLVRVRDHETGERLLRVSIPFINPEGLLLSAVRGYYRSDGLSLRSDEQGPMYKKTTLTTPGWAYSASSTVGFSPSGWARFEKTLASLNLHREV